MKFLAAIAGSLWTYRLTRFVLAGMFIVAGVLKLADPDIFAVTVDAFGLLPGPLVPYAALGLPVIEIVAGAGLLFDFRWAHRTVAALTLLFLAVLGYGLHMGLDVDCGCYGPGDPEAEAFSSLRTSFARDIGILAALAYCRAWRAFAPEAA